jgi:hypothetical protein
VLYFGHQEINLLLTISLRQANSKKFQDKFRGLMQNLRAICINS